MKLGEQPLLQTYQLQNSSTFMYLKPMLALFTELCTSVI